MFSIFCNFYFLFWVKGRGIFSFDLFFQFFGFSDHFCGSFFTSNHFVPKPLRTILDPKNLGQWGCSSGQFVAHVLILGP